MSLIVQTVDEDDQPIGQADKQDAWELGLRHRYVRVMVENGEGEILLQHRSALKELFPERWDNSAAGHVDPGETYLAAAYRKLEAGLGITNVELQEIGKYESDETWKEHHLKRFTQVYRLRYDAMPQTLEDLEVDDARWFTLEEIKKLIQNHPESVSDGLGQVISKYYS